MPKPVLTTIAVVLIAASTAQVASGAQIHHTRKAHVTTSQQFRNSNNAVPAPASSSELDVYSGGWSAPGGL